MSILSWNCRGFGNPRDVQFLMDVIVQKQPKFIFLCKTLCTKERVDKIKNLIGFEGSFVVDVVGRSGGLALFWKYDGEFRLSSFSRNHIDVVVSTTDREKWRLTGFYGEPNRRLRRNTWDLLRVLNQQSNLPWYVIGDMNNILSHEDKRGGRRYPEWLLQGFCEVVTKCNLKDLDLVGHSFAWEKS